MPKQGPSEASLIQTAAFLPIAFRPSPRPTVVVVLPSPAGVGLMAVTRIRWPSFSFASDLMNASDTLALSCPYGKRCSFEMPILAAISWIGFLLAARAISISDIFYNLKAELMYIFQDPSRSPTESPTEAAQSLAFCLPSPAGRTRLITMRPPTHWTVTPTSLISMILLEMPSPDAREAS